VILCKLSVMFLNCRTYAFMQSFISTFPHLSSSLIYSLLPYIFIPLFVVLAFCFFSFLFPLLNTLSLVFSAFLACTHPLSLPYFQSGRRYVPGPLLSTDGLRDIRGGFGNGQQGWLYKRGQTGERYLRWRLWALWLTGLCCRIQVSRELVQHLIPDRH